MRRKKTNNGFIRDFDLNDSSVRIIYGIFLVVGIAVALVCVAPLVWVILSGFKELREFVRETSILPKKFNFSGYERTWTLLRLGLYFRNSFFSVLGSVVCAVFFNGLLGYALSKIKPIGSKLVFGLVLWSMLIPATTSIVPLFMNISRMRLTGTFFPLWLGAGANAFFVILFKEFFDDLPQSFIEAARIDGTGDFTIFMKIAIPLSKAIIIVIIIYAINAACSDFLLPYLVLKRSWLGCLSSEPAVSVMLTYCGRLFLLCCLRLFCISFSKDKLPRFHCMRRVHTPPLGAKKGYVPGDKYLTKTTYPAACGGVVDLRSGIKE